MNVDQAWVGDSGEDNNKCTSKFWDYQSQIVYMNIFF